MIRLLSKLSRAWSVPRARRGTVLKGMRIQVYLSPGASSPAPVVVGDFVTANLEMPDGTPAERTYQIEPLVE